MKKTGHYFEIIFLLSAALVVVLSTIFYVRVAAVTPVALDGCNSSPTVLSGAGSYMAQSFVPGKNRISSIGFKLSNVGDSAGTVTVGLSTSRFSNAGGLPQTTLSLSPHSNLWYLFNSFSAVTVTPSSTYYLYVQDASGLISWVSYINDSCSAGTAYGGGSPLGYDELFEVYGYDEAPEVITFSSVNISNITTSSATAYWATNVMSASKVDYGTTAAYGQTASSNNLVNSHLLTLDSLQPGTTYHYKITSWDLTTSNSTADATFTTPSAQQAPGNPGSGAGSSSAAQSSSNGTSSSSASASATKTTPSVSAAAAEKPVDASIAAPTLSYVTADGKKTNAPVKSTINISNGKILEIGGKAFDGAGLSVFIGDKAYQTTADKNGLWSVKINTSNLALTTFAVSAQAQDASKNKGSEKVTLFSLKVAKPANVGNQTPTQKISGSLDSVKKRALPLIIILLMVVALGAGILLKFKKLPTKSFKNHANKGKSITKSRRGQNRFPRKLI